MEKFEEEEEEEIPKERPVSPTGQYLNSSMLCIYILGVLESEIPLDDSHTIPLLTHLFLPINPRFSSIMIKDKNGEKKWKKVEVNLEDHIKTPIFPTSTKSNYDEHLDEYMSSIALHHLPQNKPLWEIHIIKYPTSNAAGTLIFKLHHALGDGYSLMGALLSCLQRIDNPSLPCTVPSSSSQTQNKSSSSFNNTRHSFLKRLPVMVSSAFNTVSDFGWSFLKSSLVEDDKTPVRSGNEDFKLRHVTISNFSVSLNRIKEVKSKLGVSVNDVIGGLIFYGMRLYMQEMNLESSKSQCTALVLLNTRNVTGYKSVKEMISESNNGSSNSAPWGNRFAFLHVPIPEMSDDDAKSSNPLEFVRKAHKEIKRKKNSFATPLTGMLLDAVNKLKGPEAAAGYIHSTLRNSSATISSVLGPMEQMALADHPIKGMYFMVVGPPEELQSLTITVMSYREEIRIAFGVEKGFINPHKFKSCMLNSLEMMLTEARKIHTK